MLFVFSCFALFFLFSSKTSELVDEFQRLDFVIYSSDDVSSVAKQFRVLSVRKVPGYWSFRPADKVTRVRPFVNGRGRDSVEETSGFFFSEILAALFAQREAPIRLDLTVTCFRNGTRRKLTEKFRNRGACASRNQAITYGVPFLPCNRNRIAAARPRRPSRSRQRTLYFRCFPFPGKRSRETGNCGRARARRVYFKPRIFVADKTRE